MENLSYSSLSASNEVDAQIGEYIINKYNNSIEANNFAEVSSDLPLGLFEWYPFYKDSTILHVEAGFGGVAERLCNMCKSITITESDEYRAYCAKERLKNIENITVVSGDYKSLNQKYDYIIYIADKYSKLANNLMEYKKLIIELKNMLTNRGKLLLVVHNSLGVKYLCGAPNEFTDMPFEGVDENSNELIYFTREEAHSFFGEIGFENIKMYYPFPNYQSVGLVCSDEYRPNITELYERFRISLIDKKSTVLNEGKMLEKITKNADILSFSNSFFIECGNSEVSNVLYATLSTERPKELACTTRILTNGSVEKLPIYKEGKKTITNLYNNTKELKTRKFPILDMEKDGNKVIMPQVKAELLDDYIRMLIKENKREEFIKCIDDMYKCILTSSEQVESSANSLLKYAPNEDWGVILKKVYLDMVSINCFIVEGKLLFFDQEFSLDNYPAKYMLYRILDRIYRIEGADSLVSLESLKEIYKLNSLWEIMKNEDDKFNKSLCEQKTYNSYFYSTEIDEELINVNRKKLKTQYYKNDSLFDVTGELNNRKIILFGSGKYADYYFEKYGKDYAPIFIVDNNSEKWGILKNGIEIKNPLELNSLGKGTYRVVIAIANCMSIIRQLESMGIDENDYRIYNKQIDELLPIARKISMTDGKYDIGFTLGVFDLFHIGHLNILKRSKERCHHLIVGVVTDENVEFSKHKRPYIPFEERMEIVKRCKYVDEVIGIGLHDVGSIDLWKRLGYDCFFMGGDHKSEDNWLQLQMQLRSLGAELEFFPYTESTSSTKLQGIISKELGG